MSAFEHSSVYSVLVAIEPRLVRPQELPLIEGVYTLGRGQSCSVAVQHRLVSRLHAQITRNGDIFVLTDAGSINGTYVNGRRLIASQQLRNEDVLGLGSPTPLLRFIDPDATVIATGVLHYDQRHLSFFLSGARLDLAPIQLQLLLHLYQNAGEVCTRPSCARAIWGREYNPQIDANALESAVSELRRILREADARADGLIETRRGVGYILRI